jgi:hypothetical protein
MNDLNYFSGFLINSLGIQAEISDMRFNIGKDVVFICQTEIEKVVSLANSFAFYRVI